MHFAGVLPPLTSAREVASRRTRHQGQPADSDRHMGLETFFAQQSSPPHFVMQLVQPASPQSPMHGVLSQHTPPAGGLPGQPAAGSVSSSSAASMGRLPPSFRDPESGPPSPRLASTSEPPSLPASADSKWRTGTASHDRIAAARTPASPLCFKTRLRRSPLSRRGPCPRMGPATTAVARGTAPRLLRALPRPRARLQWDPLPARGSASIPSWARSP
jgi:hypothetical protein